MSVDWATIENAIHAWIANATGIAAARVLWAEQGIERPSAGPWVSLRFLDFRSSGIDWSTNRDADEPTPGAEVVTTLNGTRVAHLSIQCFAGAATGANRAVAILDRAMMALASPLQKSRFAAARIGIGAVGSIQPISAPINSVIFEPRASWELDLLLAAEATQTGTNIASVGVTGVLPTGDATDPATEVVAFVVPPEESTPKVAGFWPRNAAQMRAAAAESGDWAFAWNFDNARTDGWVSTTPAEFGGDAGLLYDPGGVLYRVPGFFEGDFAVEFTRDAMTGFGPADNGLFDLYADTSIAFMAAARFTPTASDEGFILGKGVQTVCGYDLTIAPSGAISLLAKSEFSIPAVIATVDANHYDNAPHIVLAIVDRAAQTLQLFTDLGASPAMDITQIGSMAVNTLVWSVGTSFDLPMESPPMQLSYLAVATGDVSRLRANGAAAVASLRRWIGL